MLSNVRFVDVDKVLVDGALIDEKIFRQLPRKRRKNIAFAALIEDEDGSAVAPIVLHQGLLNRCHWVVQNRRNRTIRLFVLDPKRLDGMRSNLVAGPFAHEIVRDLEKSFDLVP